MREYIHEIKMQLANYYILNVLFAMNLMESALIELINLKKALYSVDRRIGCIFFGKSIGVRSTDKPATKTVIIINSLYLLFLVCNVNVYHLI